MIIQVVTQNVLQNVFIWQERGDFTSMRNERQFGVTLKCWPNHTKIVNSLRYDFLYRSLSIEYKSESLCYTYSLSMFWLSSYVNTSHDDVIKWKYFPRNRPFVRGIHRSPVNSTHKGRWRGALVFSLICAWIKGWVNNGGLVIWETIALIMTTL